MGVLAFGLALGRAYYVNAIPPDRITPAAAERLIDTLLSPLQTSLRFVFAAALLVMLVAFLSGHSPAAQGLRRGLSRIGDYAKGKVRADEVKPWQRWLTRYRRATQGAQIGVGLVILVLWQEPTAAVALWTAAAAALAILVVELVTRPVTIGERPSGHATLTTD